MKSIALKELRDERFIFLKDGRCYSENVASLSAGPSAIPKVVAGSASVPHVLGWPVPEREYRWFQSTRSKPIYRDVFVLRDIEGLNVRQTAKALGINLGLVRTRLVRARLQMGEALAPGYDGSVGTRKRTV